jgi:ABC-type multidrug transport system ATPase subunit
LLGGQSVLLLDEPENGLDADGHQQIIDVLRDLSQKKIVVFTTHDLALALALADRLLILHQGRVACMLDSAGLTVASLRAALRRPIHTNRDATLAERPR